MFGTQLLKKEYMNIHVNNQNYNFNFLMKDFKYA